ncbi:MAG: hypothetical protein O8C61_06915 [Candidatus Methanoperedens sp.]|nr:hypothetical protein [Candidatus Methanoperedens sp.]
MNIKDNYMTEKPVENNVCVNELKVEKNMSNTGNNEDLGFLMTIFDFLIWP